MAYTVESETSHLCASAHRHRAQRRGGGLALDRCLHVSPLPDRPDECRSGLGSAGCAQPGVQRPDHAQRRPRVQCRRGWRPGEGVVRCAHDPSRLRCGPGRAVARVAAPQPARHRAPDEPVDPVAGGAGGMSAGAERQRIERRDHPRQPRAPGRTPTTTPLGRRWPVTGCCWPGTTPPGTTAGRSAPGSAPTTAWSKPITSPCA